MTAMSAAVPETQSLRRRRRLPITKRTPIPIRAKAARLHRRTLAPVKATVDDGGEGGAVVAVLAFTVNVPLTVAVEPFDVVPVAEMVFVPVCSVTGTGSFSCPDVVDWTSRLTDTPPPELGVFVPAAAPLTLMLT